MQLPLFPLILLLKIIYMRALLFPETTTVRIFLLEFASVLIIWGLLNLKERTICRHTANFLISTFCFANIMYYSFFGRLLNWEALGQLTYLSEVKSSIAEIFSPIYLLFYVDMLILLVWQLLNRKIYVDYFSTKSLKSAKYLKFDPFFKKKAVTTVTALALTVCSLSVVFYPDKGNKMAMTREVGILTTQGYELLTFWQKKHDKLAPTDKLTQATINRLKQIEPSSWPKYFGAASGKNIILIQLESIENFLINFTVDGEQITPNLNSLVQESLYFPYFYSQIGQGNTSDAEFITNTSLYPLADGAIAKELKNIKYPSLPRLLKEQGYVSLTFHANDVTFWNRDNLYPCLGFDKYYDKAFYQDEDPIGRWGSSDQVLFAKAFPILKELHAKRQKFYASLITLSSHHPYNLPESKHRIEIPDEIKGTLLGNYFLAVNYTDYTLGQFIQALKAHGLWDNTVLVVFGDHFGLRNTTDTFYKNTLSKLLGRDHDQLDSLNVPLLIRIPGLKAQTINNVGGQVDLLPTIANLLGLSLDKQLVFGQDIFNHSDNLLGFRFYYPEGTLITANHFHEAGSRYGFNIFNHKPYEDKEFFLQQENRVKSLLALSDSYLNYLAENQPLP